MEAVQVADRMHALLAKLFSDAPYVKKLGYGVDGSHVQLVAVFDDDGDFSGRLGEVVDRFTRFDETMADGIMPDIDVRMIPIDSDTAGTDQIRGLTAVIDR